MDNTVDMTGINVEALDDAAQVVDVDEVTISDLMADTQDDAKVDEQTDAADPSEQRDDNAEPQTGDGQQTVYKSQQEVDAAFSKRLAAERKRNESSDEFKLGRFLIDQVASSKGISRAEAAEQIRKAEIDRQAEEYASNPKEFYKAQLVKEQQTTKDSGMQGEASRISADLSNAARNGNLPNGFGKESITKEFVLDAKEYGVKAALAMWERQNTESPSMQRVVAEVEKRRSAVKPMQPSGRSPSPERIDFSNMSSEEFRKVEQRIKKAQLDGKTVKF